MILGIKKNIYILGGGFNPFKVLRFTLERKFNYALKNPAPLFLPRLSRSYPRTILPEA
jgi:hypothetical protein